MKNARILAVVAAIAGVLQTAPASAVPVNYNGALFDVIVTGSSGSEYNFRFTADFSSSEWTTFRSSSGSLYIAAVGFGVAGYDVFGNVALDGTNAPGTWTPGTGTINSSGCAFAANGQGPCANVDAVGSAATLGTYYWDFTAEFYKNGSCGTGNKPACAGQALPTDALLQTGNPIRADFYTNGVMSLGGPFTICLQGACLPEQQVPEPGSLLLLGLGVLGLGLSRRRIPT